MSRSFKADGKTCRGDTPIEAAKKISDYLFKNTNRNKINLVVEETTKDSAKKTFHYVAERNGIVKSKVSKPKQNGQNGGGMIESKVIVVTSKFQITNELDKLISKIEGYFDKPGITKSYIILFEIPQNMLDIMWIKWVDMYIVGYLQLKLNNKIKKRKGNKFILNDDSKLIINRFLYKQTIEVNITYHTAAQRKLNKELMKEERKKQLKYSNFTEGPDDYKYRY